VFKFVQEDGTAVVVRRSHFNQYLKSVMGQRFSAKDFRTWAGTLICACALSQSGVEELTTAAARKRSVVAAVKETARRLGNTPAVCRSSYISPAVVESFAKGRVLEARFGIDRRNSRPRRGRPASLRESAPRLLGEAGRGTPPRHSADCEASGVTDSADEEPNRRRLATEAW
jgi:DNA topoisomerase IB